MTFQCRRQVTTPYESRSNFTAYGAASGNSYYLFVANDNTQSRKLSISLAKWPDIPVGATCIINQVCDAYFRAFIMRRMKPGCSASHRSCLLSGHQLCQSREVRKERREFIMHD